MAEWVRALAWTGERTVFALELGNYVYPALPVNPSLSEETLKLKAVAALVPWYPVESATSRVGDIQLGDIQLGDNSGQLGDNSGQIGDNPISQIGDNDRKRRQWAKYISRCIRRQ